MVGLGSSSPLRIVPSFNGSSPPPDVVALIDAVTIPIEFANGQPPHLDTIPEASESQNSPVSKGSTQRYRSHQQKMSRAWDISGHVLFIATIAVDAAAEAVGVVYCQAAFCHQVLFHPVQSFR
jgi:hypothetical protein